MRLYRGAFQKHGFSWESYIGKDIRIITSDSHQRYYWVFYEGTLGAAGSKKLEITDMIEFKTCSWFDLNDLRVHSNPRYIGTRTISDGLIQSATITQHFRKILHEVKCKERLNEALQHLPSIEDEQNPTTYRRTLDKILHALHTL